ncbi:MAG: replicative DNA helicase [Opitutales bacterium]|nr:replicative DNA helicase [Opitutales bacterium]
MARFGKAGDSSSVAAPGKPDVKGRVPPHNLEAESGLIGSCILEGGAELITRCLEARLRPEAFYLPAHQVVYQVLIDLYRDGKSVDEVIVFDALNSRSVQSIPWLKEQQRLTPADTPLIELIGGPAFLGDLTGHIQTTAHAQYWMEIVREKWMLRRLINTSVNIADSAYTQQDRLADFIDSVEKEILSINEDWVQESAEKFEDSVDATLQLINEILQGKQTSGVMSGYIDVDKMTFGLHPGQMIILAARPSMGKTSFGMNIAENVALPVKGEGNGVLVFSLEMPSEQLAMRMLCGRARVNLRKIRDRTVSKDEMKKLVQTGAELRQAPIWVDDSSGLNILELRAKARRVCQREKVGLVMVDYLQLLSGTDQRVPREQQIAEISRGLKAMSKELSVPVLVLSQLNRASEKENREPRISDLRESGSIEQDADVVFLLSTNRDSDENPIVPQASHERKLIIAKQRNGPTGDIPLTFIPDYTRFENYARQPSE